MLLAKQALTPVLTKFHDGYFGISLSLSSQALLWKTLAETVNGPHVLRRLLLRALPSTAFAILWSLALLMLLVLSVIYLLRCFLHLDMVKGDFLHHIGVNYLFAPWISWLLLLQQQSSPFIGSSTHWYTTLWWTFVAPVLALDVKIYGQWFTKGKRFLSFVANPSSHLSVIGNLVGVRAAAPHGMEGGCNIHVLPRNYTLRCHIRDDDRLTTGPPYAASANPICMLP